VFHTPRTALCSGLATAVALSATAAPGAPAQPLERTPIARGAPTSTRLVTDMRSHAARDDAVGREIGASGPRHGPRPRTPSPAPGGCR
jgi:hypothetical protein